MEHVDGFTQNINTLKVKFEVVKHMRQCLKTKQKFCLTMQRYKPSSLVDSWYLLDTTLIILRLVFFSKAITAWKYLVDAILRRQ